MTDINKEEMLNTLKNIKNVPLADLKKDVYSNTAGKKHTALMQYNAMLDNLTIGAHTTTTINHNGYDWQLRILTGGEYAELRLEIIAECKKKECFDDWYTHYLTVTKFLARALTPSPFKTEGKAIFSEEDLQNASFDKLESLYEEYLHFLQMATKKAAEFTEEEIQALIEVVKKKPEVLTELDRARLLTMSRYFLNYSQHLEKITKPE